MNSDKRIEVCEIAHSRELSVIGQEVVDAIFRHNGLIPPSAVALLRPPRNRDAPSTSTGKQLAALVNSLDPDLGYDDWLHVAMALSHESGNNDEGFHIFDDWSSNGSKYKGAKETRSLWNSLANAPEAPITIATLIKMVNDAGFDSLQIVMENRDRFTKVPFEIVYVDPPPAKELTNVRPAHPLDRFSLTGSSSELEKRRQKEVFVLGEIALSGQATAIYGAPNGGKTLANVSLLTDAIADNRIDPKSVYYINADDNLHGLIQKLQVAEEFGFHMIGEGYRGFRAPMFLPILETMIEDGSAARSILILDTAKRFTDLMNKREVSHFTGLVRRFVALGGTLIALAHVNKKKTDSGKSVYAGTSDIIDDFDCAYVIELMDDGANSGRRVIAFENRKARGSVAPIAYFSYLSPECVSSYRELLDSFCRIESAEANHAVTAARVDADAPMIAVVKSAIQAGPAAKKDLISVLREGSGMSRNAASSLIDRYCGDDPLVHLWKFERRARGAHGYRLLTTNNPETNHE